MNRPASTLSFHLPPLQEYFFLGGPWSADTRPRNTHISLPVSTALHPCWKRRCMVEKWNGNKFLVRAGSEAPINALFTTCTDEGLRCIQVWGRTDPEGISCRGLSRFGKETEYHGLGRSAAFHGVCGKTATKVNAPRLHEAWVRNRNIGTQYFHATEFAGLFSKSTENALGG